MKIMATVLSGVLALGAQAGDDMKLEPVGEADGVIRYWVTSPYQGQKAKLRIIAPASATQSENKRFLYVLPVEPREETRFGDGLASVKKTGLAEKLGLIVIEPHFDKLPWYTDHPTDKGRQDEAYFLNVVIPQVENLYPSKQPQRLLLGFSKSGWGAFSLILRNPSVFAAAAAWDAPMTKDKPDQFGMDGAFGSLENFKKYQITKLLRECGEPFKAAKRLWLAGYGNFRDHTIKAHTLMDELKILHDYADSPQRAHIWESGWVEEGITALEAMAKALPANK